MNRPIKAIKKIYRITSESFGIVLLVLVASTPEQGTFKSKVNVNATGSILAATVKVNEFIVLLNKKCPTILRVKVESYQVG